MEPDQMARLLDEMNQIKVMLASLGGMTLLCLMILLICIKWRNE